MRVYIGSDHGGFEQKEALKWALSQDNLELTDCGNRHLDYLDDYPAYAARVGRKVAEHPHAIGILLCRSGEGMEMAANKIHGIRAALVWNEEVAEETRLDNDANILVIPSDFVSEQEALAIVRRFLATDFSGEKRHERRIEELMELETL